MKFAIPLCPECHEPARGTLETVNGLALLQSQDWASGVFEYAGETDIYWDEQKTIVDGQGQVTLLCPAGHEWQSAVDWSDDVKPQTCKEPEAT